MGIPREMSWVNKGPVVEIGLWMSKERFYSCSYGWWELWENLNFWKLRFRYYCIVSNEYNGWKGWSRKIKRILVGNTLTQFWNFWLVAVVGIKRRKIQKILQKKKVLGEWLATDNKDCCSYLHWAFKQSKVYYMTEIKC